MNAPRPLPPDFETWFSDHPGLTPGDLERPWRLAEGADPTRAAPPHDGSRLQSIQAALEQAAGRTAARPPLRLVRSVRPAYRLAVAASIALLALTAGVTWWMRPVTRTAPPGGIVHLTMDDGSRITLNSRAVLRYARTFGTASRRVELDGEAFFEVARTEKPFVIETFNATITVLGTAFNVRAWPEDREASTVVSVVTGVVQVTANTAPGEPIRLETGETTRLVARDPLPATPSSARLDEVTAWREGSFVFFNQPLGVIFDEIEHRFGIEISASEAIRARTRTFSRHHVRSAESLVQDLCQAARLRYRVTANGFAIYDP